MLGFGALPKASIEEIINTCKRKVIETDPFMTAGDRAKVVSEVWTEFKKTMHTRNDPVDLLCIKVVLHMRALCSLGHN